MTHFAKFTIQITQIEKKAMLMSIDSAQRVAQKAKKWQKRHLANEVTITVQRYRTDAKLGDTNKLTKYIIIWLLYIPVVLLGGFNAHSCTQRSKNFKDITIN